MNDNVRIVLKDMIKRYGPAVCDDARRCEGLLRDLCPDCRLEINSLIGVLKEGVAVELQRSAAVFPIETTIPKLINMAVDNLGLSEEIARWSVESWAFALDVRTSPRTAEEKAKAAKADRPRPAAPGKAAKPARAPPSHASQPAPTPQKAAPTAPSIGRNSMLEALQGPVTLLPLAVCLLALVYLGLFSPIWGGKWPAAGLAIAAGLGAVAAFWRGYPRERAKKSLALTDQLILEREKREEADLLRRQQDLQTGFFSASSSEGISALDTLASEYQQLKSAYLQIKSTAALPFNTIPVLARETLQTGLSALGNGLELMKVVQMNGKLKIEGEISAAEKEIGVLFTQPDQAERLRFKQELLSGLKEKLAAVGQLQLGIEQLLHQSKICEASLRAARVELAALNSGNMQTGMEAITRAMQDKVNHVRDEQSALMLRAASYLREGKRLPGPGRTIN